MKKGLTLTDILVTIVISAVFALVYKVWASVSDLLKIPGIQLDELVYGMWFIAASVAFLIIRKPGVALLAEVAAASGEFIVGSQYGLEAIIYGVLQGLGAELIFALFLYRNYSLAVASLAGIGATIGSLAMDWYKGYLVDYELWILLLKIAARTIGGVIFVGFVAYCLVKALEKTGVTNLVRPASKEDYQALEE